MILSLSILMQTNIFLIKLIRAGEPANFLAAPAPAPHFFFQAALAPGFFSKAAPAPAPGIFFRATPAPAPRGQKHPAPTGSGSLAKYSFSRKLVR